MDGWNTIVSFWVSANFQVRTVSLREGNKTVNNGINYQPQLVLAASVQSPRLNEPQPISVDIS